MRRTVQFWQVADGQGQMLQVAFPAGALVDRLQAARAASVSRYYTGRDGYRMLGVGVARTPRPHVAVYRSRHVNLPGKDVNGEVTDLGLNDGEGLAEGTHFVFFSNNIVGVLYNNEGPRTRRFAMYLYHKFGLDVSFVPVYRRDISALLASLDRVSKLEVSIPANQVHLLADVDSSDSFAASLDRSAAILGDGNVRLEVSIGQGAPRERSNRLKAIAQRVAGRGDLDRFRVAKVYGRLEDERESFPIDLKAEQLVTKKEVEPELPTSTRISIASASSAVRSAYREYAEHIRTVTATMPDMTSALAMGIINPAESSSDDD